MSEYGRPPLRTATAITILMLLLWLSILPLSAQQHPTESQVKAAYLFNFGKFVTWPADHGSEGAALEMCVLGKDPFGAVLDSTVEGESIDGRKISVKRIVRIQDAATCRILFVSTSEEGRLRPILIQAQRIGTLTVSDIPHFAEQGGIIEFVLQDGKIRFTVNRGAAEQSRLLLSSQLLKVASKVIDKSPTWSQP
jgi:hypothetical protein